MSLLSDYRASLKPLDVEEPIDIYVHRPLAFLIAKACMPTPISPNLITLFSIFLGVGSGVSIVMSFPHHMQVGGLLLFISTLLDCADGQLARMRKSSSAFGRMLDGVADLITTSFVAPATVYALWRMYNTPTWLAVTVVALALLTLVTSSFHTSAYDHFKNVFVRLTSPSYTEGEDFETAKARWEESKGTVSWWKWIAWRIYLFYVGSQRDFALAFDPHTSTLQNSFPAYDPKNAEIYRRHVGPVMGVLRTFFGFGTLVFGLSLFNALERPDILLLLRLVVLNGIFYLYVRPAQRRASRAAFTEMGIRMPDQKASHP